MSKPFHFKEFSIVQEETAMKVGTDGILLGAIASVRFKRRILDIGTGTGLIALMVAQRSRALIDAVEIDEASADEAKFNINQSNWKERITVHLSSFQQFAQSNTNRYDAILCNPPYFTNALKSPVKQRSLARHNDSLSFEELIENATNLLTDRGEFTVIIPIEDKERFIDLARKQGLIPSLILNIKPNPVKPVIRVVLEFCKHQKPTFESHLMIENEMHGDYTDEFKELTQEYYLAF